jgi:ankyrin repeat protein
MYGREEVAFFLLEHGADLRDSANSGGTALHWAAGAGYVSIVERLIQRGAALEEINKWGGTVLEQAAYGFEHSAREVNFAPVFETLLAAGARPIGRWLEWIEKVKNRSAVEKTQIKELFLRHGATT